MPEEALTTYDPTMAPAELGLWCARLGWGWNDGGGTLRDAEDSPIGVVFTGAGSGEWKWELTEPSPYDAASAHYGFVTREEAARSLEADALLGWVHRLDGFTVALFGNGEMNIEHAPTDIRLAGIVDLQGGRWRTAWADATTGTANYSSRHRALMDLACRAMRLADVEDLVPAGVVRMPEPQPEDPVEIDREQLARTAAALDWVTD